MESLAVIGGSAYLPCSIRKHDMASGLRELIALSLLAGLGFAVALARGDLLFAAFWRCHRKAEEEWSRERWR
jgi:hypothetical protein